MADQASPPEVVDAPDLPEGVDASPVKAEVLIDTLGGGEDATPAAPKLAEAKPPPPSAATTASGSSTAAKASVKGWSLGGMYKNLKRAVFGTPADKRRNPGSFDTLMVDGARVFVGGEAFDGAKFEFTKPVTFTEPVVSVSHGFQMGSSVTGSTYTFGANYIGEGQRTLLLSKIDSSGLLRANIIRSWSPSVMTRISAQLSQNPQIASVINCDIEKSGRDYTACFKTINDAVMFASYMQAVTPRLALGGELCYAAPRMETSLTLGAKYRTPSWVAAARVDLDGDMQLGYTHTVNETLAMATELHYSPAIKESLFKVAYMMTLKKAKFRGEIESTGVIRALLEEQVMFGLNLLLCGQVDYKKQQYKFGIGMTVGQM